ncbi:Cytochrome P450 monooxygenase aflN [Lachnellula suecica]|uniref:Cytochrome P450 monooxygenase aflN n=1 Tax=Lachnellula suecica TaxID=602035 RepID=A0A8T9C4Z7_9HELO|nr:Cytochrome P450 monooxygenase aflN [Lachnellula suecica]
MKSYISPSAGLIVSSTIFVASSWVVVIVLKGWRARRVFAEYQRSGLPMPKHSMLLGHLLALPPVMTKYPKNAHRGYAFGKIATDNFPDGIYYLDMWPFFGPLIICSLNAAIDTTQKSPLALRKPDSLHDWFQPIAGGPNLFTMEAEEWRVWRDIFNPGFIQAHIFKLIPNIVDEANGVSEKSLDSKRTQNPLAVALLSQLRWHLGDGELNPFVRYNPVRLAVQWRNSRIMNRYIGDELDKRYESYKCSYTHGKKHENKSVISSVLHGYLQQSPRRQLPGSLGKTFKSFATYQIRTFLFAGHDTTSSSICHIFYLLSKNQQTLRKMRDEHNSVLGPNPALAGSIISDNPHILNQLVYTNGVIKETMRLFPAASSVRQGREGVDIMDDNGRPHPTGGAMVWVLHQNIQRDPKYWPKPNEFIPERWIVGPEDPLYPTKGAWRPFENGPRNCIGQGLVMHELKIVVAVTAREFDVRDAYEEFDKLHPRDGPRTVEGERAYQFEQGGAHPADRFPCRITLRKH